MQKQVYSTDFVTLAETTFSKEKAMKNVKITLVMFAGCIVHQMHGGGPAGTVTREIADTTAGSVGRNVSAEAGEIAEEASQAAHRQDFSFQKPSSNTETAPPQSEEVRGRAGAVSTKPAKKPVVGPPGPPTPPRDRAAIQRSLNGRTASREEPNSTAEQRTARRQNNESAVAEHESRMQEQRRVKNVNER